MRTATLVLLVLVAGGAVAQPQAAPPADRPSLFESTSMIVGGAAGTVLLLSLAPGGDGAAETLWVAAAIPVSAAGGVHLAGRALGLEGSFRASVLRAAAGAATGVAVGGALLWASGAFPDDAESCGLVGCAPELVAYSAGAALVVVLPATFASLGYSVPVRPAVLAAPEGERALGLSLRIGM